MFGFLSISCVKCRRPGSITTQRSFCLLNGISPTPNHSAATTKNTASSLRPQLLPPLKRASSYLAIPISVFFHVHGILKHPVLYMGPEQVWDVGSGLGVRVEGNCLRGEREDVGGGGEGGSRRAEKKTHGQEADTSMLSATAVSQARVAGPCFYKECVSCFVVTT